MWRNSTIIWLPMLAACAAVTPYQALDAQGFGYHDEVIGENRFLLTYSANPDTSDQRLSEYWHRRARELCGSDRYRAEMSVSHLRRAGKKGVVLFHPFASGTLSCD